MNYNEREIMDAIKEIVKTKEIVLISSNTNDRIIIKNEENDELYKIKIEIIY